MIWKSTHSRCRHQLLKWALNVSELNWIDFNCRVFQHVGCPHGCGDSRRDPSSDFIRSQGLLLMAQLHRISGKHFRSFLRQTVTTNYTLTEVHPSSIPEDSLGFLKDFWRFWQDNVELLKTRESSSGTILRSTVCGGNFLHGVSTLPFLGRRFPTRPGGFLRRSWICAFPNE